MEKINLISQFIKNNNRLPIENKLRVDEYYLRIWLKTQEKIYNKNKFENDDNKKIEFEKLFFENQNLFSNVSKMSNMELWNSKYEEYVEYIEKYNQLPKEKIIIPSNIDPKKLKELELFKSLGIWKSNTVQNARIDFVTHIKDIDFSKLTETEKEKYKKRLDKYNDDLSKDNLILSKDYSILNKKDKLQYDKVKLKIDEQNKMIEEERLETSERFKLWNNLKIKFPKLF